jgi:methionyl-tRNA formyltransferase
VVEAIAELKPDIGISVFFGYLLSEGSLRVMLKGCLNLHPALLPYNRGAHPNVWSIVEGTPAGATMHYVDRGVDTGDIVSQKQVSVDPVDTGESLYRKLERACLDLFEEVWPLVRAGRAPRTPQSNQEGSHHRTRDLARIDEIDLDRSYNARELIDIIRARTFPPYPGACFRVEGRKVHLRLQLAYENNPEEKGL